MMEYRVAHRTLYRYSEPVSISHHAARLAPRNSERQERKSWRLEISPRPAVRKTREDYFGNQVCFFSVQELHDTLEIISESRVRLTRSAPPDVSNSPAWEEVVEALRAPSAAEWMEAGQFVFESPCVRQSPELAEYARGAFAPGRPLLEAMNALNERIFREFAFDPTATTVATPIEEVMRARRGVCQDFTHLALGCLRSLGLAGRYVSGYLRTRRPEGALTGADASHAWLSVFCPGRGWVDFDPTNNLMPGDEHIAVAHGRDFSDVSPVTGMIVGGGQHTVSVAVLVAPVEQPV
jgi:transglutaminase-like putative cysteine protease